MKETNFYAYATDEMRLANRPQEVSETVFKDLFEYWKSDTAQDISKTYTGNQKKLKHPHIVGKTSFAIIRERKKKESPDAL